MRIKRNIKILIYLFLGFICGISCISCDKDNNNPGYTYFPDMTYSRAYETYTENPNFKDGKTLQTPPEGTIPRGGMPFPYEKTEEDMIRAGKEIKMPIPYNDENLARGKEMFARICLQCHGEKGDGQGFLFTSGRYPFPPASLINDKMKAKPDGEIFHSITLGFGVMGAHGSIVQPDDRWKIIMYIRTELQ